MAATRYRAYGNDGNVIAEGNVRDGEIKVDGAISVAYIVLYTGPQRSEAVAGRIEVSSSGGVRVQRFDVSDLT